MTMGENGVGFKSGAGAKSGAEPAKAASNSNGANAANGDHEQRLGVELRRGIVTLAALSALRAPTYGYSLQQRLAEQGFEIDQGTLYPLLRRLDEQGLLESDWSIDEGRPRKYYRLSQQGTEVLASLTEQWGRMVKVVDGMLAAFKGDTL
jgi:PadR family transcriptional regulator, regulatory protein PadR